MSYDQAQNQDYIFTDATFGATGVAHNVIGPKGCVGIVRDIEVDVSTSLVGTTTVPEIAIGISSGDSTYGRYRLGTNISTGYATGIHRASQESITGNPPRNLQDFAHHAELDGYPLDANFRALLGRIPKDTALVITCLAGTGGSPAGGGQVRVRIDWQGQAGG